MPWHVRPGSLLFSFLSHALSTVCKLTSLERLRLKSRPISQGENSYLAYLCDIAEWCWEEMDTITLESWQKLFQGTCAGILEFTLRCEMLPQPSTVAFPQVGLQIQFASYFCTLCHLILDAALYDIIMPVWLWQKLWHKEMWLSWAHTAEFPLSVPTISAHLPFTLPTEVPCRLQLMLRISYLFSAFQNSLPLLFLYCPTATCCLGLNITSLNNHGEFRIFPLGLTTFSIMASVN